jgi:hypothetical protein
MKHNWVRLQLDEAQLGMATSNPLQLFVRLQLVEAQLGAATTG